MRPLDVQSSSVEVPAVSDYERGERFEWESRKRAARKYAKLGLVGSILIAVAGFVSIIISSNGYGYGYWSSDIAHTETMVIFAIGAILFSFTFLGFHANHGSILGLAIFIYSVIASSILLISTTVLLVLGGHFGGFGPIDPKLSIMLGWIALGFMGVGLIVDSKHFPEQKVLVPAGIIYIIACSLLLSFVSIYYLFYYFFSIIWILTFFGAILSSIGLVSVESTILKTIQRGPPEKMIAGREPWIKPTEFRFCRECGNAIDGSKFCPFCGTVVDPFG